MNRSLAAGIVALGFVSACAESTTPITQDQADEAIAVAVGGADFDPNASTTGDRKPVAPPVTCTWNATTKWTTCGPATVNGITTTRQFQFLDLNNNPQQRPDSNTRSQRSKTALAGTITMQTPPGAPPITGTNTILRNSEELVTGLGPGSTQRVANGTATGSEDSQFTDARGTMVVKRTYSDTTTGLTFPAVFNAESPWPTSGRITRNIKSAATLNGSALKDFITREVQTFAPGGKLTIVTTMNGKTRTCQVQLTKPPLPGTQPPPPPKPVCTEG